MTMGKWSLMYREGEGKKKKNKNLLGLLNGHPARLCAVPRWMPEKGHLFFGGWQESVSSDFPDSSHSRLAFHKVFLIPFV
jgi:hypothetical protein